MANFYLVRHGQTDYSERNKKIYQGFGVNLSPLSSDGVKEIINTSKDKRRYFIFTVYKGCTNSCYPFQGASD